MSELQAQIDDLVAANHILYRHAIVDGYGHVSFRSPTNPQRFFLAAAIAPGRVTEGDILEHDLDGKLVNREDRPQYSERFIHAEVYRARPDVNSVIHSHSPTVIPFSVTGVPLKPIINQAGWMHQGAPVFNTRNVPEATSLLVDNPAVAKALVGVLADQGVVLMRGHGDTVVGAHIREAVARAIYTEVNAKLLLASLALNTPIEYISAAEAQGMARQRTGQGSSHGVDRIWQMWLDEVANSRQ
jgi:ribulose-5-phosphate 4-epimerase/fuculose-1-phosphate aldolase